MRTEKIVRKEIEQTRLIIEDLRMSTYDWAKEIGRLQAKIDALTWVLKE